jgi:tetratricopeptide (TPR) repeat protein
MARIASGVRSDAHVEEIDLRSPRFWQPEWFLPHLSIRPKVGGVVPFKLRSHQIKLAAAVNRCLAEGRWLVHLKARQEGATTFCAGVLMQHVMFREGVTAGMLGHKGADKKNSGIKNMVEMCKRYWRSIPAHQQPRLPPGMTNSLEFPDLDSVLLVEAARAEEEPDEIDMEDTEQVRQEEQRLIVAIAQNPKDAQLFSQLARVYMRLQNYGDAVEALTAATKLVPDDEMMAKRLERARRRKEKAEMEAATESVD